MSAEKEPSLGRQRTAIAVLAVFLVLALGAAWAREHFTEWRAIQVRYNELAARAGKPLQRLGLRQAWKPELGVVDRCTTCHLAMGGAEPLAGDPLFGAHPPVPHRPDELGCTPCHGGQGRATTRADAHGPTANGDPPLLDRPRFEAGCGGCHTGLVTPSAALAAKGEQLMKDYDCAGCHARLEDLAAVGLRGLGDAWHARHAGLSVNGVTFAPLADEDVPAVTSALATRVGAPRLMAGKQLVAKLGCRGCHALNGVGVDGEEGPDLAELATSRDVQSIAEQAAWHRGHLLAPSATTPGSRMPALGLTADEADLVTVFLLSLRPRELGEAQLPRDRVRTSRLGERDFATDGASLYAAFCAGCHGAAAEGKTFEATDQRVPALRNPVFLALAEDDFLRKTIHQGRPGRRMPSWSKPGRLAAGEIDTLVAWLRSLEPPAPQLAAGGPPELGADAGRARYSTQCAPCHGPQGEGSELAPPLAARDNEVTRSAERVAGTLAMGVAGTAMGSFRELDAQQLRAVVDAVLELPRLEVSRTAWKATPGEPARGAATYREHCARCHEPAEGREVSQGPNLLSPAFLAVAGDGYLAGTIVRGRPGRDMPAFGAAGPEHARLDPARVADVVAFLRSKALPPSGAPPPAASR